MQAANVEVVPEPIYEVCQRRSGTIAVFSRATDTLNLLEQMPPHRRRQHFVLCHIEGEAEVWMVWPERKLYRVKRQEAA